MYNGCSSRIFNNNLFFFEYFPCHNDVHQGENVYSFLFAFHLKGLEKCFPHENVTGLNSLSEEIAKSKLFSKNHDYAVSGRHCAYVQN